MSNEKTIINAYELCMVVSELAYALNSFYGPKPDDGIEKVITERKNALLQHGAKPETIAEYDSAWKKVAAGVLEREKADKIIAKIVEEVVSTKIERGKAKGIYHVHFEFFEFDDE